MSAVNNRKETIKANYHFELKGTETIYGNRNMTCSYNKRNQFSWSWAIFLLSNYILKGLQTSDIVNVILDQQVQMILDIMTHQWKVNAF